LELNNTETKNIELKAIQSFKWTSLSQIIPRIISPISNFILAAILTPSDFGIVAASTVFISLAQMVLGFGLGPVVIQNKEKYKEIASSAFWISILTSLIIYVIFWFISPDLATVYKIPELSYVLKISGLSIIFYSIKAIPVAVLQRNIEFKKLFWIEALPVIGAMIITIILAMIGLGFMSIIYGQIFGLATSTFLLFIISKWNPGKPRNLSVLIPVLSFSAWVIFGNFETWLFLSGDNAIIGYFLGKEELGVYSLGFNFSVIIPAFIISSISAVAYPLFCKLQDDLKKVGDTLIKIQSIAITIIFPIAFGLSAISNPLVELFYGDKWMMLGEVIQLLAIMPGLHYIWSLNSDAFRAINRPDIWPKLVAIQLIILLPSLAVSAQYGLITFTFIRFLIPLAFIFLQIYYVKKLFRISIKEQFLSFFPQLISALVMFFSVKWTLDLLTPFEGVLGFLKLIISVIFGALVYTLIIFIFKKSLLLNIIHNKNLLFR
jgi:PST family polysaccharide transporter